MRGFYMSKKTINLLSAGHRKQLIPYTIRIFSFVSAVTLATVYVVYIAAGANTTIGNNISTSGTLTVGNTALFSATLRASSTLQVTGSTTLYTALTVSGTGTSTFANGLNLAGGCFAVNGTCVTGGGGGGSGTVNSGTQGQVAFYNSTGTAVSGTSTIFINTARQVGINATNTADIIAPFVVVDDGVNGTALFKDAHVGLSQGTILLDTVLYIEPDAGDVNSLFVANVSGAGKFVITKDGLVGVATETPSTTFSVQGNSIFSGNLAVANLTATGTLSLTGTSGTSTIASGQGFIVGGNKFAVQQGSGYVGIGTSTPLSPLHISSNQDSGILIIETYGSDLGFVPAVAGFSAGGSASAPSATANGTDLLFLGGRGYQTATGAFGAGSKAAIRLRSAEDWTDTAQGTLIRFETTNLGTTARTEKMRLTDAGNLGIGTTSPSAKLSLTASGTGSGRALAIADSSNIEKVTILDSGKVRIDDGTTGLLCGGTDALCVSGAFRLLNGTQNSGRILISDASGLASWSGSLIVNGSNVGIGTTTPAWNLQVAGIRPFLALSDTAAGTNLKHWTLSSQGGDFYLATSSDAFATSSASVFRISGSNGNTAIGIPSGGVDTPPTFRLQVFGSANVSSATNSGGFVLQNPLTAANNNESRMLFRLRNSATTLTDYASVGGLAEDITSSLGALVFTTRSGGTLNERARITSDGNLGIGTTSPTEQLSVANRLYVGGTGTSTFENNLRVLGDLQVGTASILLRGNATSTFSSGLDISGGCFAVNGTCVGGGGVTGSGVSGQATFWTGASAVSGDNNFIWDNTNKKLGIGGTTTPSQRLTLVEGNFLHTSGGTVPALGGIDIGVTVDAVYIVGRYAYIGVEGIAGTCSGSTLTGCEFRIYDISNPSNPVAVGGYDTFGRAIKSIHVGAKFAYVGTTAAGGQCVDTDISGCEFFILDVSNPTSIQARSGVDIPATTVNSVYVSGQYAYIGHDNVTGNDFRVIDISNPTSPVTVGGLDIGFNVNAVYVQGESAYIANSNNAAGNEFQVISIQQPSSPGISGGVDIGTFAFAVYVSGRYAFVGNDAISGTCSGTTLTGCEFRIYDISSGSPVAVGGLDLVQGVPRFSPLFVSGKYAYVGVGNDFGSANEFRIIDISNPSIPTSVGGTNIGQSVIDIFVAGKYAYVGVSSISGNDFQILDISGIDVPTASIGSVAAGYVTVSDNASINNNLYVRNGINTGRGGINSEGPITISTPGTGGLGNLSAFEVRNGTFGSLFRIRESGFVGIGTTTPGSPLSIAGGLSVGSNFGVAAPTGGAIIEGSVGIGTTTPGTLLSLHSGSDFINFGVTSTSTFSKGINLNGGCFAINGTCVGGGGGGSGTVNNGTQGQVAFYDATGTAVSGTSSVFIAQNNRVGIGTTNPQNILSVAGFVDITGPVGIGTTSPSQPLSVHGNALFSGNISAANITATGTVNVSAGSAYKYNSANVIIASTTLSNYFFGNSGNLTMTGNDNAALGAQALNANTFGTANTAVGSQALNVNTTGNSNTAIGMGALSFNTTGFFNTAIGRNALLNLNITAGDGSGANTAIGYNTGLGITTGVNNTIIGANVTGLAATLSNNIIIADGAGNQRINVGSTGSVGIGTTTSITSSTTRLFITDGNATGTPSITQAQITPLLWGASTADIPAFGLENTSIGLKAGLVALSDEDGPRASILTFSNHPLAFETGADGAALWIGTNDNVGIGTTTPGERLVVTGSISLTGNLLPSFTATTTFLSGNATSTIDTSAIPQGHSITIGTNGFPIIAYQESLQNLVVAKCNDLACSSPTISTVVSGNVGSGTSTISIAISTDGRPFITYQDGPTGELRLAICGNESCSSGNSTTTIENIGFGSGASNSIAFAPEGIPVISYYHTGNGELRFATCGTVGTGQTPCIDSSVSTSTLDGSGARDAGQFNSLAIGADGIPVISYYDVTNGNLNVAQCFNSTCGGSAATTSPDTGGDVGQYTSIAIGTDGLPVISYYDVTNGDLKVAKCANTGCTTGTTVTTQDSTGDVGRFSSITITTGGLPLIAYYDVTNADLKVEGCANASCSSNSSHKSVDTDNNVGEFASISIGTDGMPIIAYYSRTTGNLRFVRCNNFTCQNSSGGFFSGSDLGSIGKFFNNAYVESLWAKQIAIKRFDLAEDYYSKSSLEAGDIVALDPNEYLHVNRANLEDGNRVVGVVSTEPALVLSDFLAPPTNSKNYPIALAGRVPVKVNGEGGEIKVGDPIAMSSVSGVGRKAGGSAGGRNIGYALESFAGGPDSVGKIMVFVNLSDAPVNVSELTSNATQSPSTFFSQVTSVVGGWLEGMKVYIADGLVKLKELVAEKITAKKAVLDKIELKDEDTGETYCVRMKGGALTSTLGECSSSEQEETNDSADTVSTTTTTIEPPQLDGPSQAPPTPPGLGSQPSEDEQDITESNSDQETGTSTPSEEDNQSTGSSTSESIGE